MEYTITTNPQFNSLEIYFDGKPSQDIRDSLKALKYRWHGVKKCWYGYSTEDAARAAIDGAAAAPLKIAEPVEVEPGTLYAGWKGGQAGTWHSEHELKAFIMADLKKAGIKASIRFGRGGYLTSLTVTITINADDIKPFDKWAEDFHVVAGRWNYYRNADGMLRDIYGERFYELPEDEQAAMFENICRTSYDLAVDRLKDQNLGAEMDILTESGNRKLSTVKAIVSSYNHDQSNSMVDYFDRDIYDHYSFRIA